MPRFARSLFAISLLLTASCNPATERSEVDTVTETSSSAAPASTHFTVTLSGPRVDPAETVEFPADQIGGIIYDSNLSLLYSRMPKDGAPLRTMTMSVERPNVSAGTYDFADENVKLTFSLGEKDLSIWSDTGTLTLTEYSESDSRAAGTFKGQFRDTARDGDMYEAEGSFAVER